MLVVPLHGCPNGFVIPIICRLTSLPLNESFSMVLICKDIESFGRVADEITDLSVNPKVLVLHLHIHKDRNKVKQLTQI